MLKDKLEGLKVSLNNITMVEDLMFCGNNVTATIGEKNGAVCAALLELQINNESCITIKGQGFEIHWDNIEIDNNQISTKRNGIESSYKIIEKRKPPKVKRRLP